MEKEDPKNNVTVSIQEKTREAINVLQLLINEYGRKYLDKEEFVVTVVQKGGIWSLFLWPTNAELTLVEGNVKLALMQINQLKVAREKMEEEDKGRKIQEQYVA